MVEKHGLKPYRYPRMKRQTVMVKAPRSVIENTLWPAFEQANAALSVFLADVMDKVIREEVFGEAGEADEVPEPLKLC
jgi:hypothetical protein